ncbi:hypothetical protein TRFO_31998 [Tritrichomonas foetus]|uniref:Protein kinase domain-containing protein n=1 Tax=Tritrichomonas foetus TaxID=1144522 RepID=A0A1J4JQ57_9EUKA|nr:hypothetical protein TRFO_31998 [Tritrichomonas foetus]|eukprot:OHT01249.1 hypothetical protein TRFO_31998 [Tritrichomonas foetus]
MKATEADDRVELEKYGFNILEFLGQENSSSVYKVSTHSNNQIYAVKVILPQNEQRRLNFPNLGGCLPKNIECEQFVKYYREVPLPNSYLVFMEYVEGCSALQMMRMLERPLNEREINAIVLLTLHALKNLHSLGVVHNDLKANNILLTKEGEIKLTDWELMNYITEKYELKGFKDESPHYRPPEYFESVDLNSSLYKAFRHNQHNKKLPHQTIVDGQIADQNDVQNNGQINGQNDDKENEVIVRNYSDKSDIWALGITMLEMKNSTPPNHDAGYVEVETLTLSCKPEAPTDSSRLFKRFIDKIFEKEPTARPSAAKLLEHRFVNQLTVEEAKEMVKEMAERYATYKIDQLSDKSEEDEEDEEEEEEFNEPFNIPATDFPALNLYDE